ncbi:anhydro-N-acetylmuramic acid kinase [Cyanobium sp. WAJ14-Wanaka]|uniref:anhydro-N-acetylmuramic acid kinase n=1 Tax=Cyanobium sp. WAJ14-Wanaka TaxID=2823725 RepID=UPI0020CBA86E|nr:anhydro-N-acetylmuramic acid kinase [Cyanobium sp. WAJ14-Wanaka]MCP9776185.1 anhydro-N-acetylmuramic acid kinase [Cyanobium sp. WAJ14-Wanaka]
MRVLGLMSGTSADGVDAVLANFAGPLGRPRWKILGRAAITYPAALRQQIVAVGQGEPTSASALLELAEELTNQHALAARSCDPTGQAQLVGCHGQTLWHRPPGPERLGASWQLLRAPQLAQQLNRPVVFDFRSADLALGGQGAPLVPAADAALLPAIGGWRALLNLGGIANLTLLPPAQGPEARASVLGWDCGPANSLVDMAVQRFSAGEQGFDEGGLWAAKGQVDWGVIEEWLQEPYFQQVPPKSTGREKFGQSDLEQRLARLEKASQLDAADAIATLTAFTAAVVAQDLALAPPALELLVAGGGARNPVLMAQLRSRCRGLAVESMAGLGIGEGDREALAFALLAWWQLKGHPGNLPSVTGATRPSVLGVCVRPG